MAQHMPLFPFHQPSFFLLIWQKCDSRSVLLNPGNRETLMQYGYSPTLVKVSLVPEPDTYIASISVEICDQFEACDEHLVEMTVVDRNEPVGDSALIQANAKAKNFQTLLQMTAPATAADSMDLSLVG